MTQRSREALAVLCSVVKHTGSGQSTKKCGEKYETTEFPCEKQEMYGSPWRDLRDVVECFSPPLNYIRNLAIQLSLKTVNTRIVQFVISMRIFVPAHFKITLITALCMFTNLCLILLLLLAGSLVSKVHFQLTKKR